MRLIAPDKLALTPDPGRRDGSTYARTRASELLAWRRGERPELRVEHRGAPVAPERIDWARVDAGSGPSGKSGSVAARVSLDAAALESVTALGTAWGLDDPTTIVRRAVKEVAAALKAQR